MTRTILLASLLALFACAALALTQSDIDNAAVLLDDGEFKQAKQRFEEFSKEAPDNALCKYYLARAILGLGDHDKAIDIFKNAIDLDGSHAESYHWLGTAYVDKLQASSFIKKKSLAGKIKKNFELAVETDPENVEARESLAHFYFEAPGFAGGDKDKALAQIAEISKRDAEKGHWVKADYHIHVEEWDAAADEFEQLVAMLPEDPMPWYAIGRLRQDTENYGAAFEAFEKALTMEPGDLNTIYQIGRTSVLSGGENAERGEECLTQFLAAEESNDAPSHASAHWRLGMLYEARGDKATAREEYETALELDPKHDLAKKSLRKLKKSQRKHRG